MNNNLLYVLQLENDKWFLHLSNMPEEYIFYEAKTLFDFVKKNNPIKIYEIIKVSDNYDINSWVKKYMEYFGIENVRGGLYKNEVLSDFMVHHILAEQKQNEIDIAHIFYKLKEKTNLNENDFINQHDLYQKLDDLGFMVINRQLVSELEWLNCKILTSQNNTNTYKPGKIIVNDQDNNRYKLFMKDLEYLYDVYFRLEEDKIKIKKNVLLRKPNFVFDGFFYHKLNMANLEVMTNNAIKLISDYEFMMYTIINLQDNVKFDLFTPLNN